MQKALAVGLCVGAVCGLLGVFLVLRRHALLGDAMSHVAFGGVAAGLFAGIYPMWSAFAFAVMAGVGLQKMRRIGGIPGDAAVGILLVSGLSIGIIIISSTGGYSVDIFDFLFGSILLVGNTEAAVIAAVSLGVIAALVVMRRHFMYIAFSEEQARVSGLRVEALGYAFVALASVTVVAAMSLVGVLLISALVIIPSVTAMTMGRNFGMTMAMSVAVAAGAVAGGFVVSVALDIAMSGAITLVAVAIFVSALAVRAASSRQSPRGAARAGGLIEGVGGARKS